MKLKKYNFSLKNWIATQRLMHIRFLRADKMGRTMAIEKSWSGMRKYLEKEMLEDFLQKHGN